MLSERTLRKGYERVVKLSLIKIKIRLKIKINIRINKKIKYVIINCVIYDTVKSKEKAGNLFFLLFWYPCLIKEYYYETNYAVNTSNLLIKSVSNSSMCTQPSFVLCLLSILRTALSIPCSFKYSMSLYNL